MTVRPCRDGCTGLVSSNALRPGRAPIALPDGQIRQSVSMVRMSGRGDRDGRDDVRPVAAVAAPGRGSSGWARHRHLPRDGSALVEPVWSDVRRRDPPQLWSGDALLHAVALACRRGLRLDRRQTPRPLASLIPETRPGLATPAAQGPCPDHSTPTNNRSDVLVRAIGAV